MTLLGLRRGDMAVWGFLDGATYAALDHQSEGFSRVALTTCTFF